MSRSDITSNIYTISFKFSTLNKQSFLRSISFERLGQKTNKMDGPERIKPDPLAGQLIENKKFQLSGFGIKRTRVGYIGAMRSKKSPYPPSIYAK